MNTQITAPDNPADATTPDRIVRAFLDAWWHGDVIEAVDRFSDRFTFADHALGLEFKDKERLAEFLTAARAYFPDTRRADHTICRSEGVVVSEWTLTARPSQPFLDRLMPGVPIRVRGVSIVQVRNGKIGRWSDYYDQRKGWRYGLVSRFAEWLEI
jgi:steroid delta-isomerase-like uncharacterized protein